VVQAVDKFTALNPQHKFIMLDKGQFKYEIA
jgi:alkyl hydroperoxide reductase subunit AhpF